MAYPDKLLADDEEIVEHLHPHWVTVFWPVVRFLLIVGGVSFAMAVIPAGQQQGILRLLVLALAAVLLVVAVAVPLLRWRTTHYVITTHRLLFRDGILTRRGRDLGLSRITDVSFTQRLWERIVDSGTLTIESAGSGGATVLRRIPDADGIQHLLNHLVEEDAGRRPPAGTTYVQDESSWGESPWGESPWSESSWGESSWGESRSRDEDDGPNRHTLTF